MTEIIDRFKKEPAIVWGSLTVIAASASGVWEAPALAFLAAAFAGLGTVFTRRATVTKATLRGD